MSDEKKSTYTGYTEARKKANEKYLKESVEDIRIRVPKGRHYGGEHELFRCPGY